MTHVWLAQCLCPDRHTICATAGDATDVTDAQIAILVPLREQVDAILAAKTFNPWCGLCHAPASEWTYEVRRTAFTTMEEAEPALRRLEDEQIVTAAIWGDMPRSD